MKAKIALYTKYIAEKGQVEYIGRVNDAPTTLFASATMLTSLM